MSRIAKPKEPMKDVLFYATMANDIKTMPEYFYFENTYFLKAIGPISEVNEKAGKFLASSLIEAYKRVK